MLLARVVRVRERERARPLARSRVAALNDGRRRAENVSGPSVSVSEVMGVPLVLPAPPGAEAVFRAPSAEAAAAAPPPPRCASRFAAKTSSIRSARSLMTVRASSISCAICM